MLHSVLHSVLLSVVHSVLHSVVLSVVHSVLLSVAHIFWKDFMLVQHWPAGGQILQSLNVCWTIGLYMTLEHM